LASLSSSSPIDGASVLVGLGDAGAAGEVAVGDGGARVVDAKRTTVSPSAVLDIERIEGVGTSLLLAGDLPANADCDVADGDDAESGAVLTTSLGLRRKPMHARDRTCEHTSTRTTRAAVLARVFHQINLRHLHESNESQRHKHCIIAQSPAPSHALTRTRTQASFDDVLGARSR
jgi:hypothetical protein